MCVIVKVVLTLMLMGVVASGEKVERLLMPTTHKVMRKRKTTATRRVLKAISVVVRKLTWLQ